MSRNPTVVIRAIPSFASPNINVRHGDLSQSHCTDQGNSEQPVWIIMPITSRPRRNPTVLIRVIPSGANTDDEVLCVFRTVAILLH